MNPQYEANRNLWNTWTPIHARSRLYALDAFRAGESSLQQAERDLVGDVAGKSLLHLQCHFGMDTLSWARLGADVTGVDISDEAIRLAGELAAEAGHKARFIRCDIYDLPEHLDTQFDIVYTSYGVLAWLADLPAWGRLVARYLRPGGRFYLLEGHPILQVFSAEVDAKSFADFRVSSSYFAKGPYQLKHNRSYAMSAEDPSHARIECYEWTHTVADILNALCEAGLRIEHIEEYAEHAYQQHLLPVDNASRFAGRQSYLPVVLGVVASKR